MKVIATFSSSDEDRTSMTLLLSWLCNMFFVFSSTHSFGYHDMFRRDSSIHSSSG